MSTKQLIRPATTRLFQSNAKAQIPVYSEYVQLLSLYGNKYNNKILSHFKEDTMKVFIYVMQDHLKYINEQLYKKICEDLASVKDIIDSTLNKFRDNEKICFCCELGVNGYNKQTQIKTSMDLGISKPSVSRYSRKVGKAIREALNSKMFPEIVLPKIKTDVTGEADKPSLYTSAPNEPTYAELQDHLQSYSYQFTRNSLSIIHNRGLKAAIGSFMSNTTLLTEDVYKALVEMRLHLEDDIREFLLSKSLHKVEINSYLAYWQFGMFSKYSMTPETIAEHHKASVTTIRNHIKLLSVSVNTYIMSNVLKHLRSSAEQKAAQVESAKEWVTRPLSSEQEETLVTSLASAFGISSLVPIMLKSQGNLKTLGELFSFYSVHNAIPTRILMNKGTVNDVRKAFEQFNIDVTATSDSALRQRKSRLIKNMKKDFCFLKMSDRTVVVTRKEDIK